MRFLTTFAWLRPPTDHGVDRPELEAQQCVQVTGTNRPRTYTQTPFKNERVHCAVSETTHPCLDDQSTRHEDLVSQSYGGHSGRETPGPIPNPEAKPASADGTALARVWESRTPPNTTSQSRNPRPHQGRGFPPFHPPHTGLARTGRTAIAVAWRAAERPTQFEGRRTLS